jgi:hypothetical protein
MIIFGTVFQPHFLLICAYFIFLSFYTDILHMQEFFCKYELIYAFYSNPTNVNNVFFLALDLAIISFVYIMIMPNNLHLYTIETSIC